MTIFDMHCVGGQCRKPPDVGLLVAPRVRLTWPVPIRVPMAVDMFGNPTAFIEADPEVAGKWDQRCWPDHP